MGIFAGGSAFNLKNDVGSLNSRSNPALVHSTSFRGRYRYRYRDRLVWILHLKKAILDTDSDTDPDAELRISGLRPTTYF